MSDPEITEQLGLTLMRVINDKFYGQFNINNEAAEKSIEESFYLRGSIYRNSKGHSSMELKRAGVYVVENRKTCSKNFIDGKDIESINAYFRTKAYMPHEEK